MKAEEMRNIIDDSRNKRRQVYDGGKIEGSQEIRELLGKDMNEFKSIVAKKQGLIAELKKVKERHIELTNMRRNILSQVPREQYKTEAEVQKALNDKKNSYETTSISNQQEKTLLKEIDMLKKLLPQMQQLTKFEPELEEVGDRRKKLQKQIDELQVILNKMDDKIQSAKA